MTPDKASESEVLKALTLIDKSLRRIAHALEAIAHKYDENFKTFADTQREQAHPRKRSGSR